MGSEWGRRWAQAWGGGIRGSRVLEGSQDGLCKQSTHQGPLEPCPSLG